MGRHQSPHYGRDTGQKKMIEQKTSHWKLEIFLFHLVTNERLYINKFVAIYQTWLKFSLNSFTMKLNIHTCYLSVIPKIGRNLLWRHLHNQML